MDVVKEILKEVEVDVETLLMKENEMDVDQIMQKVKVPKGMEVSM